MSDSRKEVPRVTSELVNQLGSTKKADEWRRIARDLVSPLSMYWDVHPHSAMEMLESAVRELPVSVAQPMVREVVREWRKNPSYDALAGGSAGHCYLSALILSDNYDLAEPELVKAELSGCLKKELAENRNWRDAEEKRRLLIRITDSV